MFSPDWAGDMDRSKPGSKSKACPDDEEEEDGRRRRSSQLPRKGGSDTPRRPGLSAHFDSPPETPTTPQQDDPQDNAPQTSAPRQYPAPNFSACVSTDFQDDIQRWKELYETCLFKLRELQEMKSDTPCETSRCWDQLREEMEEAARTLQQEHAMVEEALRRHNAVLAELLGRLQQHLRYCDGEASGSSMDLDQALGELLAENQELVQRLELNRGSAGTSAQSVLQPSRSDVSATIGVLKDLIAEHEALDAEVQLERNRRQKLLEAQAHAPVHETPEKAEGALRRSNSLLKLQVKRLKYEFSRLAEAQSLEAQVAAVLLLQSEEDMKRNAQTLLDMRATHTSLLDAAMHGHVVSEPGELYRRASGISFLDNLEDDAHCVERQERLERRLHSDRVYRDVDYLDEQNDTLDILGHEMNRQIEAMNVAHRLNEKAWLELRHERDELTKHVLPELERLREVQELAKDHLELENKLRKENFLFKNQLEDFQKDLLEVEAELVTGGISRRTKATHHLVSQLEHLLATIQHQNEKLREEMAEKNLTVSSSDSLASSIMDEDEFKRHIDATMKKMELRIQEDLERRAIFLKPKKYVLEPPSASKVPFRGQRNVIRVVSKDNEWRRKTTAELHMENQMDTLRREILGKLSQEKEKAKQQLLRYESERHGAMAEHAESATAVEDEASATKELGAILGQLDAFLKRTAADMVADAQPEQTTAAAQQLAQGAGFGENMKALIIQLEKLQSALQGPGTEGRSRGNATQEGVHALERGQALLDRLPPPDVRRGTLPKNESSSTIS